MLSPNFSPFPTLTTKRLLLRQMTLDDAPAVHRLRSNPDVMRYINRPLTQTVEEAAAWVAIVVAALDKCEGITWSICLKETPAESLGSIGLWRFEKENYRAEIGYMLDPRFHGQGIMSEAIEKVVDFGFREIRLHSIEAKLDPRNQASAALARKAGFVQEGHFREDCFYNGEFSDTAVYSLLTPFRNKAKFSEELQQQQAS